MSSKSEKDLEFIFNEKGVLSQVAENYEYRQEQKDMALSVLAALENNEFSLIDAPTGVGKSLAYLIPSFLYAVENNERVVIATDTNALLYQLASKDIPLVQKILKTIMEQNKKLQKILKILKLLKLFLKYLV